MSILTRRARFAFAALISGGLLEGATVLDAATGPSLAGATVTVTRVFGTMSSATFEADGAGAKAIAVGSAGFSLIVTPGDTGLATWTLTNTDPSTIILNRIVGVTIDLTLAGRALFDTGTTPSTPLSGPGVAGVTPVAGIGIVSAGELLAWSDPANTGDMFLALAIEFDGGFTTGASASWMDDTDLIDTPEPSSLALLGAAALTLALRRRRRGCRGPGASRGRGGA